MAAPALPTPASSTRGTTPYQLDSGPTLDASWSWPSQGATGGVLVDFYQQPSGSIEQRVADARRRQLELMEETNRKLMRLSQTLDFLLSRSSNDSAVLPPHTAALAYLQGATKLSKQRIGGLIGVSRQTIHNWEQGLPIAATKRVHLLAVRDVIERATLQYTTVAQLAAWLDMPRGVDGRTPSQLLAAGEIDRARLLAVTTPSPGVRPPSAQALQPVSPAFHTGVERVPEALLPVLDEPVLDDDADPDVFLPVQLVE